ncbi:sodium- and chloride-dependent glycine transporter 1 isoform X2 [Hyalella azteca]|uniref:Transporter n=1 Tax=Hyalella azteca TaxID=294128 RepID=A0A979FW66_HYAAZ|nr:sodium- and chloride-dependent glycine transporter 1 isoform X2 [Hyalella azteca]
MGKETKVMQVTPADDTNPDEVGNARGTWDSQCEFFLSCLGYAVGFGNVWRFPYLAYKNGGAIFLLPYTIMLLVAGLPLFFLELSLGQFTSLGPNKLFLSLSPIFMGLGWGMLVISMLVAIYYNVILAWSLYYTFASFTSVLPWGHCNNTFNSDNCFTATDANICRNQSMFYYKQDCVDVAAYCRLSKLSAYNLTHCVDPTNSSNRILAESSRKLISASEDYFKNRMLGRTDDITWDNMGGLNWELVGCLALAWIIVGLCLIKGIKSSGKVVYFTALFPYVVLVILFFRGITLEGAYTGIEFYILTPNVTKLNEIEVWADAATQIFYSLGSSFGGLITLASYNKFRNNCMRDAIVIAFSNCATSVFAGFVIFSFLGFMAVSQGTTVPELVTSGSGLAFVVYAEAVTNMPVPPLWAFLFFFMLITLGLDSQFTMVETLSTAVFDQWPVLRSRKVLVVSLMSLVLFLCGLTMVLQGGLYMFELFNFYSAGISVIVMALIEVSLISYVYGFPRYMKHITDDMGITVPKPLYGYWAITLVCLTPISLVVILVISVMEFVPAYIGDYVFPPNIQTLGWFITAASIVCIPVLGAYVVWTGQYGKELVLATKDFCSARERAGLGASSSGVPNSTFRYTYDNDGFQTTTEAKVIPSSNFHELPPPYNGHM